MDPARSLPQFVAVEPLADADHARLCIHRALPHRKRPASERGAESQGQRSCLPSGPWGSRGPSSERWRTKIIPPPRPAGRDAVARTAAPGIATPNLATIFWSTNRQQRLPLAPDQAFAPIRRIGGRTGWYFGNLLWRIRGLIDLMMGGVGMRRGRPDPESPLPGSTLDFWRVEIYEPGRRLRLFAEMKVPGRAWLEFRAEPDGSSTRAPADRTVRTARAGRAPVLVSSVADSRSDVPGDAEAHCYRGVEAPFQPGPDSPAGGSGRKQGRINR